MITNKNLVQERAAPVSGEQRIYDLGNGYGLSAVNGTMLHSYPFAWEIAVVKGIFKGDDEEYDWEDISYGTPLTNDVEVFSTDEEANKFIEEAIQWASGN